MNTVFFYFTWWPEAAAAAAAATGVYTGPGPEDYWHAFARQWGTGRDLVTIEQDVLIHDQVLEQFASCPEPWCEFPWMVTDTMMSTCWLGCTKFSAELQAAIPVGDLCLPNPPELCGRCTTVPCYRHLDVIFLPIRTYLGQEFPHAHEPLVRHLRA